MDTIRDRLPLETRVALAGDQSTIGNCFLAAKHRGVIRSTGFTLSTTPSRRRGVIRTRKGTTMAYADFLARKQAAAATSGPNLPPDAIHPALHEWQNRIVRWAIHRQRAAIWADTGLGKTWMQIEWARHSGNRALIAAPLAVCSQTIREAAKLGTVVRFAEHGDDIDGPGLWITNYERVHTMPPNRIDAFVLDESSILKQSDGKLRTLLIDTAQGVPARLACSATPAPNDPEELTNQAEFLGRMARNHMLATYFVHDADGWRLKGHARDPMIEWMSTWAVAIRRPSDIGGDDTGYTLPGLEVLPHYVASGVEAEWQLFATELGGVSGRAQVRRQTLVARVDRAAELVSAEPTEPWVLWCGLNDEGEALARAIPGAVNVHGAMDPDEKARLLLAFADGDFTVLITKPSIASMGMNWQHCARMVFVGLGDSYEQYYQSIRRCYRYGQQRVVEAHIVLSDLESQIANNVARKERQSCEITTALIEHAHKIGAAA